MLVRPSGLVKVTVRPLPQVSEVVVTPLRPLVLELGLPRS